MIKLPIIGELTVHTATDNKEALLTYLDSSPAPELDLSGVDEIDTAGLQLLFLAKREAERSGKTVRFTALSRSVLDVLTIAGLDSTLTDRCFSTAAATAAATSTTATGTVRGGSG